MNKDQINLENAYISLYESSNIDVNNTIWYHGSASKRDNLEKGDGVDGVGLYLTKNKDRAERYAKKDKHGNVYENFYIHQIKVNVDSEHIWDYSKKYDLSKYTNATWLNELILKHGDSVKYMNGANARIYLGWDNNDEFLKHGFKALLGFEDLIILDLKIIAEIK
jgi:hypothetical protein